MKRFYSPKNIVDSGLCIGCGICAGSSLKDITAAMHFDAYGQLKPYGSKDWEMHGLNLIHPMAWGRM
ncbi:MAG TPA: hypothetical protein VHO46_15405 [Bacteroidales bacterium]|nr:hypothetical protein [Bacteroidales bacterium]